MDGSRRSSVVVKWNFIFFTYHHGIVAIGTWSLFLGWPWLSDLSPKMKFYIFLSWSRCSKRSAGISFYIFCHDPGVVNIVSAGIKIYVFLSSSGCSKRSRSNDILYNVTLHMVNILPMGWRVGNKCDRVKGHGKIYENDVIKM